MNATATLMEHGNTTHYFDDFETFLRLIGPLILVNDIVTYSLIPVGTLGLITNSLNVVVYGMIGFQESVFVCFFFLSVCDLCFIIIRCSTNIFDAFSLANPERRYYADITIDTITFYEGMIFDISACVKTFIAVQRGCCVAFPFHTKKVFTNKRAAAVILCSCLLNVTLYVFLEFLKVKEMSSTNKTSVVTLEIEYLKLSSKIRNTFNKTALVFACEVLVLLSLVVIVYGMVSTSKWRQSLAAEGSSKPQTPTPRARDQSLCKPKEKGTSNIGYRSQHNLPVITHQKPIKDKRELRVVKQVTLISTVHLVCYTPVAINAILFETIENNKTFELLTLYVFISEVALFLGPFNAAINFFIYYIYNYKFKHTMLNKMYTVFVKDQGQNNFHINHIKFTQGIKLN